MKASSPQVTASVAKAVFVLKWIIVHLLSQSGSIMRGFNSHPQGKNRACAAQVYYTKSSQANHPTKTLYFTESLATDSQPDPVDTPDSQAWLAAPREDRQGDMSSPPGIQ
jgi:hypothetical protein